MTGQRLKRLEECFSNARLHFKTLLIVPAVQMTIAGARIVHNESERISTILIASDAGMAATGQCDPESSHSSLSAPPAPVHGGVG